MRQLLRLCILILTIGSVSPLAFGQDFTGTWILYGNGYKGELYLKQDGNQVRGWEGVNGVNLDSDTITGTVNGNEILFTRNNPFLARPQEWRGFIMLHDNPQIEARRRMTGADAMAGIASHNGLWCFGWYATRFGPYREEPPRSLPALGGAWSCANQPTSITQDSNNKLVFTNEAGSSSNGTFADASTVVATDWEGGLRGSIQDNGNTIRWANGTVWYRSGPTTNLARGKPAQQSSTYSGDYPASSGVDGRKDDGSMFHTNNESNPWWQVDLQGNYALSTIMLYNRTGCCSERQRTVQVLLSQNGSDWQTIYANPGTDFRELRVEAGGRRARYVRVQLAEQNYFHLQEVEVYGAR